MAVGIKSKSLKRKV